LSDIDPTDHALATIASILETPETRPEPELEHAAHEADAQPVVPAEPLAPEPVDAHGYSKAGPGPMDALRFRWTVQRGDDEQYYVHETIGDHSTPLVNGPMSSESAVKFVDERQADAHRRFEVLRDEIAGRASVAEIVREGEA
jgi:hypothetical protein